MKALTVKEREALINAVSSYGKAIDWIESGNRHLKKAMERPRISTSALKEMIEEVQVILVTMLDIDKFLTNRRN